MRLEYLLGSVSDAIYEKVKSNDGAMSEEEMREIADKVGLAAIKYGDLSNQPYKDYVFDVERFTAFEGNTGPYIMYSMVRIKSILNKFAAAYPDAQLAGSCLRRARRRRTWPWPCVASMRRFMRPMLRMRQTACATISMSWPTA